MCETIKPKNQRRLINEGLTKEEVLGRLKEWIKEDSDAVEVLNEKMAMKGLELDDFLRMGTERSNLMNRIAEYKQMKMNVETGRPILGVGKAMDEVKYAVPRK